MTEEELNQKVNECSAEYTDVEVRGGHIHKIYLDGRFTLAELKNIIAICDEAELKGIS